MLCPRPSAQSLIGDHFLTATSAYLTGGGRHPKAVCRLSIDIHSNSALHENELLLDQCNFWGGNLGNCRTRRVNIRINVDVGIWSFETTIWKWGEEAKKEEKWRKSGNGHRYPWHHLSAVEGSIWKGDMGYWPRRRRCPLISSHMLKSSKNN
jgi:hypothetical protein